MREMEWGIVGRRSQDERLTTEVTQRTRKRFAVRSGINGRDLASAVVDPNDPKHHTRRSDNERLTTTGPKRQRQQCLRASGTRPTAFSGQSPATYGTAARTKRTYGCTTAPRSRQHHSHSSGWTGVAARRRGAAATLRETTTARRSSAAVIPAGAWATTCYQ